IVTRARVAADVDALDIGAYAFIDHEADIDEMVLRVALAARAHRGERVAVLGDLDGEVFDRLLDRVAVIDVATVHPQNRLQRQRIDGANVGLNLDAAKAIKGAFLDREGDDEALDRGVIFASSRDHLYVGIAVSQIKAPDQIAIGFDPVGIVDVGRLQKTQEVGCGGLDDLFEPVIRISVIADEYDVLDAGLLALPDLENQ